MSFPSIEQYIDALQIPQHTLLDKKLAAGRVETTPMGLPFGRSGQFALTFKIFVDGRAFAFRCFQSDRASMQQRYTAISAAVRAAGLPYFVSFEYLNPGIRVQQQNYPALGMDWAQGPPLGVYVEQHYRDPGRLRAVLQQLHGMALALEGAGIAHGDIQTGNILVGPSGELKLVDYDGMYVPALTSLGAIETGHPNFQHPQRAALKPFDVSLDRFSFALLHATLTALIESPSLWTTLHSDPEALLLRATDLANPTTSEAFRVLTRLPGSGPTFMRLVAVTSADYTQTPTFSDFLAGRNIPPMKFPPDPAVAVGPAAAAAEAKDATVAGSQTLAQLHAQGVLSDAEFAAAQAKDAQVAQLQKLARLHAQGALSDAEFAAAQAKDFDRNATLLAGLSTGTTAGTSPRTAAITPPPPSGPTYMTPQPASRAPTTGMGPGPVLVFSCIGIVAGLFAIVLIILGISLAVESVNSSPAAPVAQSLGTPSPSAVTPEATDSADLVGSCWAQVRSTSPEIAPVDCDAENVDFKVASVADTGGGCPGEWRRVDGPGVLCMEPWPPITYQTCVKVPGEAKYCAPGLEWTYLSCWTGARGGVLQQQINGQWKTVKRDIAKNNECEPGFPWTVEFTRKAAGPGVKNYRLYFPPADGFTETLEPITVTVREK